MAETAGRRRPAGEWHQRAVATRRRRSESRILDAAVALFRELGYDATTVEMIAAKAGVGVATVYNRFQSKAALAGRVFASAEPPVGDSIRDHLEAFAIRLKEERGFAEGLHRTLADRTAQATAAGISGPLAKLVRRGQQAGEIRSDLNADEVAALAVNLLVVRVLTRDEPPQASSTSVFDLLLYGVAGTDSPRRPAPGSRRRPR